MKKTFLFTLLFSSLAFLALAQESGNRIKFDKAGTLPVVQPLVMVDGHETNIQSLVLDPNRIQRIEVLKDKASASKYGDKGKDGVILITTKPGTEFYTLADFVNAEKKINPSVKQIELNGKLLTDMAKLLIDKTAYPTTMISSDTKVDEKNCNVVFNNTLVITTPVPAGKK